jgi:hypothetical protein
MENIRVGKRNGRPMFGRVPDDHDDKTETRIFWLDALVESQEKSHKHEHNEEGWQVFVYRMGKASSRRPLYHAPGSVSPITSAGADWQAVKDAHITSLWMHNITSLKSYFPKNLLRGQRGHFRKSCRS